MEFRGENRTGDPAVEAVRKELAEGYDLERRNQEKWIV
jgi:hypothetical protein